MNFRSFFTRLLMLTFLFVMVMGVTHVHAQSGGEQISWDDDEEEEEVEKAFQDVVLTIEGEEMDLNLAEYSFERELTLNISARNLKPGSFVWFKAAKAGIKLGSQSFQSNKKGELDLEVKTGKRKGGAMGEIHYFDMNGKKYVKQMKVKVI